MVEAGSRSLQMVICTVAIVQIQNLWNMVELEVVGVYPSARQR
jgi:hypothetical protein